MTYPTHVVVDLRDGFTFSQGPEGLFTDGESAAKFAGLRNDERRPGQPKLEVFRLVPLSTAKPADYVLEVLTSGGISYHRDFDCPKAPSPKSPFVKKIAPGQMMIMDTVCECLH